MFCKSCTFHTSHCRSSRFVEPKLSGLSSVSSWCVDLSRLRVLSSSISDEFRSSSMSHTGLGGRLRGLRGCTVSWAGGLGVGSRSSSMSHTGLGERGRGPAAGSRAPVAFCFPLSCLPADAAILLVDALGRGAGEGGNGSTAFVAALRKGFSNASLMRFTLTWPKPGSWRSCADDALAMSAKL